MPAVQSRGTEYARRRGLSAILIALALAMLTAVPFSPVYADEPPGSPSPSPSPTPTAPANPADPAKPKQKPKPATEASPAPADEAAAAADAAARAEAVIAVARAQIGKPYRLGREGPDIFDCSGLVYRAFTDAGEGNQIGVARMRAAGYMRWFAARNLLTTSVEDAERGDLVIYNNGSHIGIYLGDGRVISAITTGVTVHTLDGITIPVTAFLAVDWSGERGPFVPGVLGPITDVEAPASLVPPIAWSPTAPSPEVIAGPAAFVEERIDMRTANSRTYEDADGKFTTEFFGRPIHYLPADSTEWQPIDLRFREPEQGESGLAIADTGPTSLTLLAADSKNGLLSLAAGEFSFGLGLNGADRIASAPELIDGSFADYRGVFAAGGGLRVFPRTDGVKVFLVLAKEPANNRFTFRAQATGIDGLPLTFTPELDGSLTLRDAAGVSFGRITRPMLLDSSDLDGDGGGVRPMAVNLAVETAEDATQRLVISASKAFLDEAVYPAFIDLTLVDFPSAATAAVHTFASSIHPDSNFSTYQRPEAPSYSELWHGRRPGRRDDNEAYLRFAAMRETLAGARIESASLAAFPYWQAAGDETRTTWLGRVAADWDARTLTWNTRPVTDPEFTAFETAQGQWSAMDVTAYAFAVINGLAPDYGLVMHATGEDKDYWKRFVAETTLGGGGLEPRLVVSWTELRPVTAGATRIDASTMALNWVHPLIAPDAWRVQVQVATDEGFITLLADQRIKKAASVTSTLNVGAADLAPGTYFWRVRARYGEDADWSAWSNAGSFSIAAPPKVELYRQFTV